MLEHNLQWDINDAAAKFVYAYVHPCAYILSWKESCELNTEILQCEEWKTLKVPVGFAI